MLLVKQDGYPKACLLACIAMIEGVSLEDVIRIAGTSGTPDYKQKVKIAQHFNRLEPYQTPSWAIRNYSDRCLAALMRKHTTLLVSINSVLDQEFAHCAVIHRGELYDPYYGLNPSYSWDKAIMRASPIPGKMTTPTLKDLIQPKPRKGDL